MYQKECNANVVLRGDAYHEDRVKWALIQGEATRICRTSDFQEEDLNKLRIKLGNNGYAQRDINRNINIAKIKEEKRQQTKETQKQKVDNKIKNKKEPFKFIMQYQGKSTRIVRNKLRKMNVSLVNKKCPNLEGMFAKKFKYKTDLKKGLIYRVHCECGENYIGETYFNMEKRLKEHKRDFKIRSTSNAVVEHCRNYCHNPDWTLTETIHREINGSRRRIKEAIYIADNKPTINISKGIVNIKKTDWQVTKLE